MIIWRDVPVLIRVKCPHIKKLRGRVLNRFHLEYGDIPVARFNEVTNKWEPVENLRGLAYAARKRQKYRTSQ